MKKLIIYCICLFSSLAAHPQSLLDTLELRAFMDGMMLTHLKDKHIAGATVAVIKDGKILMSKGYGFSDDKKQKPVKADSTLFRIGSISKMFTWFSVMQLVSQGKLNLNEDINVYLKDFKIAGTFPQPVTLKNLMTHTPGFEDLVIGLFAQDSASLKPLGEILSQQNPNRVRAPGTFASYSNHGTGMAAYIVEQVSGMTFNQYVEKNILDPLGMKFTSFRQPLPARLQPYLSKAYQFSDGELKEQPFEFVPLYPAGAAASSATDMTQFMKAILSHGRLGDAVLLDSATLAVMEGPAHQHHPDVNPMRLGFMDMSRNGVTVIGHGGDTFWFHSLMALFPESKAGLFVSFNTDTGGGTYMAVLDEFMARFYPEKNQLAKPLAKSKQFLEQFAGSYRPNRYPYHDITTISSIFNDATITVADSTRLKLVSGETVRYLLPVGELTFREEHSSRVYAFKKNDEGRITNMFHGTTPIFAFDKVGTLQSAGLHAALFSVVLITMLLVLIFWPFAYFVRRGYYAKHPVRNLPFSARFIGWMNYFLLMVFFTGTAVLLSDPVQIVYDVPGGLKVLLVLPILSIFLTLLMGVWSFRILTAQTVKVRSRIYYVMITLISMAALWQLYFWNFIGYHY